MKSLIMVIVFVGGIYGLLQFEEDENGEYSGYLLLYIFLWIVAVVASFFWALFGTPPSARSADVNMGMKILGVCRYCGKKLPSFFTAKCPHCTADL